LTYTNYFTEIPSVDLSYCAWCCGSAQEVASREQLRGLIHNELVDEASIEEAGQSDGTTFDENLEHTSRGEILENLVQVELL
jgi:hypothetical protein